MIYFRENILIGADYVKDWYENVIDACALTRDLQLLDHSDMTEVGERGITLSGGQKQRISLARALYSSADIYLLDDPLSAVDAKVGQHIFNKCVRMAMKNKTVILVTHGMQYLRHCDQVIFMKDGQIAEIDEPEALLENSESHLAQMNAYDHKGTSKEKTKKSQNNEDVKIEEESALQKGDKEEDNKEYSSFKTLMKYLRFSGHPVTMTIIYVALFSFIIARMMDRIFLQLWLNQGDGLEEQRRMNASYQNATDHELRGYINYHPNLWINQLIYTMIIVVMLILGIIKGAGLLFKLMHGSLKVHSLMLGKVMRSPMAFFDVTPGGWIMNRFSKDMDISK